MIVFIYLCHGLEYVFTMYCIMMIVMIYFTYSLKKDLLAINIARQSVYYASEGSRGTRDRVTVTQQAVIA